MTGISAHEAIFVHNGPPYTVAPAVKPPTINRQINPAEKSKKS